MDLFKVNITKKKFSFSLCTCVFWYTKISIKTSFPPTEKGHLATLVAFTHYGGDDVSLVAQWLWRLPGYHPPLPPVQVGLFNKQEHRNSEIQNKYICHQYRYICHKTNSDANYLGSTNHPIYQYTFVFSIKRNKEKCRNTKKYSFNHKSTKI